MKHRFGLITGRFQPFHNEHLRYFELAWKQSERVLVGITNPDPSDLVNEDLAEHRHLAEANPFTFFERLVMIREGLSQEGFDMGRVFIVPFPIHHPDRWLSYVPRQAVAFVVAYSPWEVSKAERFQAAGLEVVVEDSLDRGISGEQVRLLMAENGEWQQFVPKGVAQFISGSKLGGKARP